MTCSIASGVLRLTLRYDTLITITNARFTGTHGDATELSFFTFGGAMATDSAVSS